MVANDARPIGVRAASEPPVIITSAKFERMVDSASPMAWVADAQAVATAVLGPWAWTRMEMLPLAALTISFGMVKAETRSGPLFMRRVC